MDKKVVSLVAILLSFLLASCMQAKREQLTIADVNSDLRIIENTPLDAVKNENISYAKTGKSVYDEFFRKSAITYGGFAVANTMVEDFAANIKSFAGAQSLDEAVMTMEEKKQAGELKDNELKYFVESGRNLATAAVSLQASVEAAPDLIPQAEKLLDSVKSDFKPWESPGVVNELKDSITRLTKVMDEGLPLIKNLTTMSAAVISLSAAG